jgi:aminopeptidase N
MSKPTTTFWPLAALPVALLACSTAPMEGAGQSLDVVAHVVTITPDFASKSLAGQQSMRLARRGAPVDAVLVSSNAMVVSSATINGLEAKVSTRGEKIAFEIPQAVRNARTFDLKISYAGSPKRGVSFGDASVYTTYFACDWMFCEQDRPGDKANFALTLNVPDGQSSLGIGTQQSGRHSWASPQPFSSYLYGFAAGRFSQTVQNHRGAELVYINATGLEQPMADLFGTTPAMVDFFAEKAGLPLPTRRYSQILVPGGEAQEQGTYSVIGLDNIRPILTNPQEDWVIAHELAHQWWGNSITCASWQDFWLNEGITVFMVAAWKQHQFGEAAYQREIALAKARWDRATEAGWDRPLAFDGTYPSLRWRRAIQYSKGAVFMDHLRRELGEQAFWRGLRAYSRAHAGKTVTSEDFQRAMERASRRDLSALFDTWVYSAPAPPPG